MARDVMRVAADLTPDALAGLMSLAATISQAPILTAYTVESHETLGEDHLFSIRFATIAGYFVVRATWREIDGVWKVAAVSVDGLAGAV